MTGGKDVVHELGPVLHIDVLRAETASLEEDSAPFLLAAGEPAALPRRTASTTTGCRRSFNAPATSGLDTESRRNSTTSAPSCASRRTRSSGIVFAVTVAHSRVPALSHPMSLPTKKPLHPWG